MVPETRPMATFTLGDPALPVNAGVSSYFTRREQFPLVILSTPTAFHCYVEKIHYWNLSPKPQKLAINSFFIHHNEAMLSTSFEAEKVQTACSFAVVGENLESTMLVLDVVPPLLIKRGYNVGVWDQENGCIEAISSFRRAFTSDQYGFYVGGAYHWQSKHLPVQNWLRYATSLYFSVRRLSEEERQVLSAQGKREGKMGVGGPAIIAYASKEEFGKKLEHMLKGPPVDAGEIMLEDKAGGNGGGQPKKCKTVCGVGESGTDSKQRGSIQTTVGTSLKSVKKGKNKG